MLSEIAQPSGTFVHQLPSGGSSGAFSLLVFIVIAIAFVAAPSSIVLDCFVSADSLFVLSILFNYCQINSHRLIKPSESVVGAAVPWPSLW